MGLEGLSEGSDGLSEGPEGLSEGPEGLPEGSEGLPGGQGGRDVRRDVGTYVRTELLPILHDFVPCWGRCPKRVQWEERMDEKPDKPPVNLRGNKSLAPTFH